MKTIIGAVALVALLVSGLASAVDVKERGAYMGAAIGSTKIDDDELDSLSSIGFSIDDEDTGLQLWGGYKFFKWFAVEGRYSYLGEYSASGVVNVSGDLVSVNATEEASALTGHAVFILPFGASGIDIYGQVGLGILGYDVEATGSLNGFSATESEDGTEAVVSAGFGVRWTPAPPVTLSLGFDAWGAEIEGADITVASTRLGVQYNF